MDPGSAAHHVAKRDALRSIRGTETVLDVGLPSAAQPDPVLARASRDEIDHRAHCREIDEIGMRQEPEIGHVDQFLRGDPD
jgi:hypothetical protein